MHWSTPWWIDGCKEGGGGRRRFGRALRRNPAGPGGLGRGWRIIRPGEKVHEILVSEDALEVGDLLAQFHEFFLDLLALESGEAAQAHLEDCVGLRLGKTEALDKSA